MTTDASTEVPQSPKPYTLTPEQLEQAKRDEEEFRRLTETAEQSPHRIPLSEDPERQRKLIIWSAGAVLTLLVLWLLTLWGGSPKTVLAGGALAVAGLWIMTQIELNAPVLKAVGAGMTVMGFWLVIAGFLMTLEEIEMLDPTARPSIMAEESDFPISNVPWDEALQAEAEALARIEQARAAITAIQRGQLIPGTVPSVPPTGITLPSGPGVAIQNVGGTECFVEVQNSYLCTQYVFLDGQLLGTVAVNQRQSWQVAPGSHTLVCADSDNIRDNPVSETLNLNPGEQGTLTVHSH